MEITELLIHTKKHKASDLHLASGQPPIMRINGDMMPLKSERLTQDEVKGMLYAVMTESQKAEYERDLEIDFAVQFGEDLRFRVNAFNALAGPSAVFRTIPTKVLTIEDLGMPDILKKVSLLTKGLVLVTGPTGSGKSTTLAAMIDYINTHTAQHILTVEDPVEFVHQSKRSLVNQRELGTNTISFSRALKSALREDPDVILVGELRDLETIQLALTAAETGHLVMGTLHTISAPKTVDRIIDVFPAADKSLIRSMLASSLEAVISQTLLKTADGNGRVAALEILLGTPAVRNLVREGKIPQIYSLLQIGSKIGMRTMKDSVYSLLERGLITSEEAKFALNMHEESAKPKVEEGAAGSDEDKANSNKSGTATADAASSGKVQSADEILNALQKKNF
ncbi:MAG: type IV pilus twitching motility protein PilT [Proteobacteria bacterium]|nr:type IV pilus twitching motility protein PilT [Pseudomonadota bacterium]